MPNLVNRLVTEEYQRSFEDSEGMVFVALGGLTVAESEGIRGSLAEQGAQLRMVRNSLARRVLANQGFEVSDDLFLGNIGIAYGSTEAAIHAAKVFTSPEVKKAGKVAVRGGVLESRLLDAGDAAALAGVPDKDTLRSKIIGCIQGPMRGLASVLNANQGALARVLSARSDQLEG